MALVRDFLAELMYLGHSCGIQMLSAGLNSTETTMSSPF
jgi:hypothetical protein